MGSPKLKDFPKKKSAARTEADQSTDNAKDKQHIDILIKQISQKIKDPELARKAALIISEMLKEKSK